MKAQIAAQMEAMKQDLSRIDAVKELKQFNDPKWQRDFAELQKNPPQIKLDIENQIELAKNPRSATPNLTQRSPAQ